MKSALLTFVLAAVAGPLAADPAITGVLSMNGEATSSGSIVDWNEGTADWSTVTGVCMFDAQWDGAGGDYSGMYLSPAQGVGISIGQTRITDYWDTGATFSDGTSDIASFDVTSATFSATSDSFTAQGNGIAYLTGFAPTQATWTIEATSANAFSPGYGEEYAFFDASGVAVQADPSLENFGPVPSVPDEGYTALFVGGALAILGMARLRCCPAAATRASPSISST